MRQLFPKPAELSPRTAYAVPSSPWLRANMVSSIDGAIQLDGRVGGLTGGADQEVLLTLRALADVVLVGAQTVRVEGYGPWQLPAEFRSVRQVAGQPDNPVLAIVTRSARLDPESAIFDDPDNPPMLIMPSDVAVPAELADRVRLLSAGTGEVDLAQAIRDLREQGFGQLLCEGGPQLLGELLAEDLLDELCCTTAALAVGSTDRGMASGPSPVRPFTLDRQLIADGELFARWRRSR